MSDLRVTQSRALRHVTDEKAGDVTSKECGIWIVDREGGWGKAHRSMLMFMQIKICAFKCNNILTKLFAYYANCRPWKFIISFLLTHLNEQ